MNVCSISFLVACAIGAILFDLCPWKVLRQSLLAAASFAFLATCVPNWPSWVWFAVFLVASYWALQFLNARPSRDHVIGMVGLTLFAFMYLKRYECLTWILPAELAPDTYLKSVELIGLSYMLFKMIHMAVDQFDGQLAPYGFFSYLNYQLAFFTLQAGPIQRYNDFHESWEQMGPDPCTARDTLQCWNRILTGMLQMGLIAPLLWYVFDTAGRNPAEAYAGDLLKRLSGRFYIYPVYLYFNFTGYTNIALGCGGLVGFRLPENFNHPFIARNMIDFWTRWHMSLSRWIRDYVFMSSYKVCAERFGVWSRWCGYVLLFLSMFVAGVWHGTTSEFAVFGAIMGLGVLGTQIYGDLLKAGFGRVGLQRYMQNQMIHAAAIAITFHYTCFAFLFFSSGVSGAWLWMQRAAELLGTPGQILSTAHLVGWSAGIAVGLTAIVLVGWSQRRLGALVDRLKDWMPKRTCAAYVGVCIKAVLVAVVLWTYWGLQQKDPVVVYMRF